MKHYGKLTAAAAAGFMTLSAMGVAPVFAETDTANVTVIVNKTENVKDPVGKISFNADPRTPGASESPLYGADTIAAGPDGGLSVADIDFSPSDTDTQTTTKTAAITINKSAFSNLLINQHSVTCLLDSIAILSARAHLILMDFQQWTQPTMHMFLRQTMACT